MAVPKRKTSPSKRNMRRSHHALKPTSVPGMPELRRAEAAAQPVRGMRPLQRPRDRLDRGLKRKDRPRDDRGPTHRHRRHGRRQRPGGDGRRRVARALRSDPSLQFTSTATKRRSRAELDRHPNLRGDVEIIHSPEAIAATRSRARRSAAPGRPRWAWRSTR